jgi:urea transport system permease protein
LREATYSEKASIAERLSQTGHPSVRAVLTALLEDRLYYRNSDQKVFIVKSADADPLSLIDPLSLKDAGSAPADGLTKIGTNNGLRSVLRTTVAHFALSSPDAAVRLEAVREMSRSLDDRTVALLRAATGRGNEFQRQEGNRYGLGARRAGRLGHKGASRSDRHAEPRRQPGCAEQAGAPAR